MFNNVLIRVTRDLVLPGGSTFNNGVAVRATTQYAAGSWTDPGADMIFVNGTYAKETIS